MQVVILILKLTHIMHVKRIIVVHLISMIGSITSKARMITIQEAVALGCTETSGSCPKWMVVNTPKSVGNEGYWTMNAYTGNDYLAWNIYYSAGVFYNNSVNRENYNGIRAVIVISK